MPPTLDELNEYASNVCQRLAQRMETTPPDTEEMRGFAGFIRAAVNTHVNYLNRQSAGEAHAIKKTR